MIYLRHGEGANWSATPVPGTGDTATFSNAGNGRTTIDLGAGVTNKTISFDTANAAAYTIGVGAAGSQTLALDGVATGVNNIYVGSSVGNDQLVKAKLLLNTATGTCRVTKESGALLELAGDVT